ncbi:MAG: hypothetical protein A3K60_02265 [Euryarchaeota archaeon RBG_19FT_COMBO_56_21]|nr:MAG: hypothetical protein A3K60_02265 [Euryarchaeota archaeon RBG_19FT_COMBO_56_21]
MRKITAVTFDLWDTLIKEHPGGSDRVAKLRIEGIGKILSEKGAIHSLEEIQSAYQETGDFLAMTWSKRRDMSARDQVLFMLSSVDAKLASRLSAHDMADIERIYSESILDNPPVLLAGAEKALEEVRGAGYRMGLISNTGRTPGSVLRILMDRMGILEHFDVTTFSNEIQVRKPAEMAFMATLDRLKVVPRAAVHIGDDPESDVEGAKRCGMKAIQILAGDERPSDMADARRSNLSHLLDEIARL